ncbi:MAG: HAMP domain-containing histidine kinase [Clostridia bacterium]|nr:HAMP domain-containing histidine kinase [Clostridia bacterium]
MSLKRRNIIAWILILFSAMCWIFGKQMLSSSNVSSDVSTNLVDTTTTTISTSTILQQSTEVTYPLLPDTPIDTPADGKDEPPRPNALPTIAGNALCIAAIVLAGVAIFVFRQKDPLLGADGIAITAAVYFAYVGNNGWIYALHPTIVNILVIGWMLLCIRELWGWVLSKCSLSWCISKRLSNRCPVPQLSLLALVGWIILSLLIFFYVEYRYALYLASLLCAAVSGFFGVLWLWKYGSDLNHFQKQLNRYQQGLTIEVKNGTFQPIEAQLLEVQAQHEEAIRTAVTSERFKVELISNVSHDLRTPLTSILGYSELLKGEALTPEGQEQLHRLHQKAGYMNDLVESLFELTKVSSGVAESKQEEIDLIRLLEQTIGLFEDQLVSAGLTVRRHYSSDTVLLTTDGARMHQVFANLLGNAIKYALSGTRIHLEVTENESNFRIRMTNTASYEMDFSPDEIMQRFARGDKARSTQGSGLGLAIAQTYTESVGGTFHVSVDGDQFNAIVELPKTERVL